MAHAETRARSILERLAGRRCPSCERGQLRRKRYKGNRAVVCEHCETPRAQFW